MLTTKQKNQLKTYLYFKWITTIPQIRQNTQTKNKLCKNELKNIIKVCKTSFNFCLTHMHSIYKYNYIKLDYITRLISLIIFFFIFFLFSFFLTSSSVHFTLYFTFYSSSYFLVYFFFHVPFSIYLYYD